MKPERFERELRSVERDGWKLIVSSRDEVELYHLVEDPGELTDLAGAFPRKVAELMPLLGPRGSLEGERPTIPDATADRLRERYIE